MTSLRELLLCLNIGTLNYTIYISILIQLYCNSVTMSRIRGIAWLKIMGSIFDNRVYCHFFTITVDYNSLHIELLLNSVSLANLCKEFLTVFVSCAGLWSLEFYSSWIESESESYVTSDSQSASLSWNKAPIWGLRPDICYSLTITVLF
jgi:hypothetical protein